MRDGVWAGWEDDNSPLWDHYYVDDIPEGDQRDWFFGPDPSVSPAPKRHTPDGVFETHWSSGKLRERSAFVGNRRHGAFTRYYQTQNTDPDAIEQQGSYADGRKIGSWDYYDSDGTKTTINHGN